MTKFFCFSVGYLMKLRFNHNCLFFHYASKSDIYLAGSKLAHTLCFIFDQGWLLYCA